MRNLAAPLILTAIAIAFSSGTVSAQVPSQACVDVAKIGLVDRETMTSTRDYVDRVLLYARSERNATSRDIDQFSASVKIPVGKILFGGSTSMSEDEFQQIREMDETTLDRFVSERVDQYTRRETANLGVIDLVDRCFDRPGFAAWPSFGPGNFETPALILSYTSREMSSDATINVRLTYPRGTSCSLDGKPARTVTIKNNRPATLHCARDPNSTNSALVTVNTDSAATRLTGGDLWFPPVKQPAPKCKVAEARRIELSVDDSKPWTQTIGPYCDDVVVTMSAGAEAKAQVARDDVEASFVVYRGGRETTSNIVINDIRKHPELRADSWVSLGKAADAETLPANSTIVYLLILNDKQANTMQGKWIIEVRPSSAPASSPQ